MTKQGRHLSGEPLEIAGRLRVLKERFNGRLHRTREELDEEIARLASADPETLADGIARLDRMAHQVAGSAGVFGSARISAAAHELQSFCSTGSPAEIARAVKTLRREIAQLPAPVLQDEAN